VLSIKGEASTHYFTILCADCGEPTENEYLRGDPDIPHFKTTCKKCKYSTTWKLGGFWKGLPLKI